MEKPNTLEMKKIIGTLFLPLFFLLTSFPLALAQDQEPLNRPAEIEKRDLYQAEQWLRIMRSLWEVEDYPLLTDYCWKTIKFYPGTSYARQAEKFLKKIEKPEANRKRKFIQENPGLVFPVY